MWNFSILALSFPWPSGRGRQQSDRKKLDISPNEGDGDELRTLRRNPQRSDFRILNILKNLLITGALRGVHKRSWHDFWVLTKRSHDCKHSEDTCARGEMGTSIRSLSEYSIGALYFLKVLF